MSRRRSIARRVLPDRDFSLLDLLDHLLEKGVVLRGELMLGVAGVDLIYLQLSALLGAADRLLPIGARRRGGRAR